MSLPSLTYMLKFSEWASLWSGWSVQKAGGLLAPPRPLRHPPVMDRRPNRLSQHIREGGGSRAWNVPARPTGRLGGPRFSLLVRSQRRYLHKPTSIQVRMGGGAYARIAFEDPFAHGVVHVAMRITVCCALHRAPMLGIHRCGLRILRGAQSAALCTCKRCSSRLAADIPLTNAVVADTWRANDPSAGSPTETLLRLLLPLSDKVYSTLRKQNRNCKVCTPKYSPDHSIGRSDGRCVQRAGT